MSSHQRLGSVGNEAPPRKRQRRYVENESLSALSKATSMENGTQSSLRIRGMTEKPTKAIIQEMEDEQKRLSMEWEVELEALERERGGLEPDRDSLEREKDREKDAAQRSRERKKQWISRDQSQKQQNTNLVAERNAWRS